MEQPAILPPPVPPKTRHRPATVPVPPNGGTTAVDVFHGRQFAVGEPQHHVVKISINPDGGGTTRTLVNCHGDDGRRADVSGVESSSCVRISLSRNTAPSDAEMIQKQSQEVSNNFFYYGGYNFGVISSGQVSPSDTLDSGTCSDLDGTPPPASTKKKNGVSVTVIGSHKRAPSSSSGAEVDSDDNESNSSCDSITSGKMSPLSLPPQPATMRNNSSPPSDNTPMSFLSSTPLNSPQILSDTTTRSSSLTFSKPSKKPLDSPFLPATLLHDIRQRTPKSPPSSACSLSASMPTIVDEKSYEERQQEEEETNRKNVDIDPDMFFKFHINEHRLENGGVDDGVESVNGGGTFAGYRDILGEGASTIRSAKGTVRGVKNRVRAGIATFLQIHEVGRNYKEKDAGKVVVYTTTMGVLRTTYQACMRVKQILRLLMVKFEERDVFMSSEYQSEIQERMRTEHVLVPQVFVDGVHVGDAETIERLNETGELRRIMKPYKSLDVCTTCKVCGGYRLLPCQICKGSKKSVHRNHFTAEFVALKCMNCDEVGLVRCSYCS